MCIVATAAPVEMAVVAVFVVIVTVPKVAMPPPRFTVLLLAPLVKATPVRATIESVFAESVPVSKLSVASEPCVVPALRADITMAFSERSAV